ncbi:unnamed protein product, partial [Mesorhabditis spiculigera]
MSSDIAWQVIRNNSAFLRTRKNIPKKFSVEKFNLTNTNSQRHNGLINKKGIDVSINQKGELAVAIKSQRKSHQPVNAVVTKTLNAKNGRSALRKVGRIAGGYKAIHALPAQRRASQLLRSLKHKSAAKKPVTEAKAE